MTSCHVRFSPVTIERWYYLAWHGGNDPVEVLRQVMYKDHGKVTLPSALTQQLLLQYRDYPYWSYQLHYNNLTVLVKANSALGPVRSYSTVRWYMHTHR